MLYILNLSSIPGLEDIKFKRIKHIKDDTHDLIIFERIHYMSCYSPYISVFNENGKQYCYMYKSDHISTYYLTSGIKNISEYIRGYFQPDIIYTDLTSYNKFEITISKDPDFIESNHDRNVKLIFPEEYKRFNGNYIFGELYGIYNEFRNYVRNITTERIDDDLFVYINKDTNEIIKPVNKEYNSKISDYVIIHNDLSNCVRVKISCERKILLLKQRAFFDMDLDDRINYCISSPNPSFEGLDDIKEYPSCKIEIENNLFDTRVLKVNVEFISDEEKYGNYFSDFVFLFIFDVGCIVTYYKKSYDNEYDYDYERWQYTNLILFDPDHPEFQDITKSKKSLYLKNNGRLINTIDGLDNHLLNMDRGENLIFKFITHEDGNVKAVNDIVYHEEYGYY